MPKPIVNIDPEALAKLEAALKELAEHKRPMPGLDAMVAERLAEQGRAVIPPTSLTRAVIVSDITDPAAPTMDELNAGHDITGLVLDETSEYRRRLAEQARALDHEQKRRRAVEDFENSGAKLTRPKGYRRGGRRRKSELKGISDLFGPTLLERRDSNREKTVS